jgi:nucleoside-diphosphate-sugar epimerase
MIDRDLLDANALTSLGNDYSTIFHLAAIIGVANVIKRPYAVLTENVLLLMNALEFARRQECLERFVFASTSEVYAGTLQYFDLPMPTPEDTPLALTQLSHPRTSYLLSKLYGEALCRHSGVPFTIVRPHNVYGPRMGTAHVIPQLLHKACQAAPGGNLEVYSPGHRRVFCYIGDAIEMLASVAESPKTLGETLNVGNSEPEITMKELAKMICEITEKKLEIVEKEDTPGSPRRRCPDMTRMTVLVGPRGKIGLREGITRTYEWYKDHIFGDNVISTR